MGFGTLSIAYFILYAALVDLNNIFTYFWLLLGVVLLAAGIFLFRLYRKGGTLPKWFVISSGSLCGIILLFFAVMLGMIVHEAYQQPQAGADYMIVLGARVRGDRISALLKYRLDTALEYLSDNPDTVVVVSGGQGSGENMSEAAAMQAYLVEHGIQSEHILMDDASLNTDQNIQNSIDLIYHYEYENAAVKGQNSSRHIVLISNGFHLFRATRIMKQQIWDIQNDTSENNGTGSEKNPFDKVTIEGIGAPSKWYVAPNSYVREVFAVVKYKLCGQI